MSALTDLFVNLLKTSLSGGIIILLVMLLRLIFRETPKAFICLCWTIAILRLLLPFPIEVNWSLQPSTAILTDRVQSFQVQGSEIDWESIEQNLYSDLPVQATGEPDIMQILGFVWMSGTAIMLGCALVSYIRLRLRVRESVKIARGVYWCPGLDTAFLFGYFRPRIYLPETDGEATKYIYLHELAHLRRGDHWLMLAGYLALCLHWFNPLAWISYIYLCRDIESACDERVIRVLDTEGRKAYASALLFCGKHRSFPVSCPVAFGEISIKQRIAGVLNYRKPAIWICILLLVSLVGLSAFFLTNPVEYPPYYMVLMNRLSDPMDQVCDDLDIKQEDLIGDGAGNYATPIYVEYADVTMRLYLHTTAGEEGETLRYFSYNAVFNGSTDEGDQAAANVAKQLYKTYGAGELAKLSSKPDLYKKISAEEVTSAFNGGSGSTNGRLFDYWDITDSGHGNLEEHLDNLHLERKEQYDDMLGSVCYFARFYAAYDPERNTKTVTITYRNYLSFTDSFGEPYATKLSPPY